MDNGHTSKNAGSGSGLAVERVSAPTKAAPTARRTMKNEFMTSTKKAVVQLRNLQQAHTRIKERADTRLRIAQDRHALELSRAEKLEAEGWQQLMAIPGMTITTAAAPSTRPLPCCVMPTNRYYVRAQDEAATTPRAHGCVSTPTSHSPSASTLCGRPRPGHSRPAQGHSTRLAPNP